MIYGNNELKKELLTKGFQIGTALYITALIGMCASALITGIIYSISGGAFTYNVMSSIDRFMILGLVSAPLMGVCGGKLFADKIQK